MGSRRRAQSPSSVNKTSQWQLACVFRHAHSAPRCGYKRRARANAHQLFASEPSLANLWVSAKQDYSVGVTARQRRLLSSAAFWEKQRSRCYLTSALQTSSDGHDRCPSCLGFRHAEAALVDESCSHCGNMTMAMLRSRYLLARRGGIPLALPRSSSSGRRTTSAQGQGDLRITVRASPSSTSPRASHSSSTSHRLGFPDEYAGSSDRAGPSISFGAPADDGISITASGDELGSGEDDSAALPPSGRVALPESDPELTAMLSRAAESIGLHYRRPPSSERSRLDDWFLGAQAERRQPPPVPFFPEVHEEVTRSWKAPFSARNRPSASSVLTTLDGGAAQGYVEVPPVERAIAMQLCPQGAAAWRGNTRLPSRACKFSSALTAKAYGAAGQAASALHAMALLQVHQAKALKQLHEGDADPGVLQELRTQAVSLAPEDYQTRLRDSVRPASPQVQGHSVHLSVEQGCPCLACRSRGPTGEGRDKAGPSSRDEVRVLQPLLHRTQERRWVTTNPGPARSEPGPSQAPVQDVDAETHLSMRPSLRLVCSNRPEGRLLPCLDPPSTQTVSPLCVRGASIPVQGPSLRAIPVASCLHQGRRSSPCTVKWSRHSYPQLPRRLAHPGPVSSTVVRTQGYAAQCSLQRKRAVPLKHFQRLLGHMASSAAIPPHGLLHMRPLQRWLHDRVPRWAWRHGTYRVSLTPSCRRTFSPWSDLAFLRAGVPLEQVSRHVVVSTDASATGWGAMCNGQKHLRSLRAVHVPGELNRAADELSRQHALPGEWRLHPEVLQLIWRRFGDAQVDLFASPDTSHCQLFFSLSEGTLGTDALACSWPRGLRKYAFPPVSLLAQTLCKVREDEEQVLLVAPYWPNRTWFPELMLLATAPPWQIPLRRDLLSQRGGTLWHPRPDLWNLHVWSLDGTRRF